MELDSSYCACEDDRGGEEETRHKLKPERTRLDIRKVSSGETRQQWGMQPTEVAQALFLEVFKTGLDKDLSNLVCTQGWPA